MLKRLEAAVATEILVPPGDSGEEPSVVDGGESSTPSCARKEHQTENLKIRRSDKETNNKQRRMNERITHNT
jgi:hypothetical protein